MLLIEDERKRFVMVKGADGQRQAHGPFDTEDEACWYLNILAHNLNEASELIGFKVIELQVQSFVQLTGMFRGDEAQLRKIEAAGHGHCREADRLRVRIGERWELT